MDITNESVQLAEKYIGEKVVGQTNHSDCIPIATLNYAGKIELKKTALLVSITL